VYAMVKFNLKTRVDVHCVRIKTLCMQWLNLT